MKIRVQALSRQVATLSLLSLFAGCGEKPGDVVAEKVDSLKAAVLPESTGTSPSAHFATVNGHLDQGGLFYGYADIDGDADRVLDIVQKGMDTFRDEMGADIPDIDLSVILDTLGLQNITAMGASSIGAGPDLYRNQMFIHTPTGPKGLLTILGKESAPLLALKSAPAGSHIIVEQEFRLSALKEIALGIYKQLPKGEGMEIPPLDEMMDQPIPIPNFDMTIGEFIDQTNGKVLFTARFSETEKLDLPVDGKTVSIPAPEFVLDLHGLGWIFEKVGAMIPQGGPFQRNEADGVTTISMQVPPGTPFSNFQPTLVHDQPNNRLVIATSPAFLEACAQGSGDKITSDPAFMALSEGLPTDGNAFTYISPQVREMVGQVIKDAMAEQGAPDGAENFVDFFVNMLGSVASVTAKKDNGIHTIANSTQSFKSSALMGMMTLPAAAMFGSMQSQRQAMGMAELAQAQAQEQVRAVAEQGGGQDASASMTQTLEALRKYAGQNDGKFPDSLTDLVPDFIDANAAETALKWRKSNGQMTALVYFSGLKMTSAGNPVLLATPEPDRSGNRTVGYLDATTAKISEDDFFKAARASIEQSE